MSSGEDDIDLLPIRRTSRISGFYRLTPEERRRRLVESRWLSPEDAELLTRLCAFDEADADAMIENVVGLHALPLGVALNFVVNGVERLVPMAVEEPSIVAACSYAARMVASGGGFVASADPPLAAAQIELREVADVPSAVSRLRACEPEILRAVDRLIPRMVSRGGGARELEVRILAPHLLCVHVLVDCRDAMGANTVNAVAEGIAPTLAALAGARFGLRIVTNLCDRRRVRIRARVPPTALANGGGDGDSIRDAIVEAQRFAELDPWRATTHNKGIMNGIDAVLVACGNDWRAVEAGAHAWAARNGTYMPLTCWRRSTEGDLEGELELPLATSTVGGAARNHGGVRLALKLADAGSATELAMLAGCAGLASNLAALRALATEGIQRGHMALHARRIAAEAGASGELIDLVAAQLSREQVYRPERAAELLASMREKKGGSSR